MRTDGEGVAKCSGKFSEEIKVHLARLRGEFFTWKKQRGSDKVIANERTAESRIETAWVSRAELCAHHLYLLGR
jgi:hypothetical protein